MSAKDILDAFADVDIESEDVASPPFRSVRSITAEQRKTHIRWAASGLVATGIAVEEITSLACLVTPINRVQAILRSHHYERAGEKITAHGQHIGEVLIMLAKHHVHVTQKDLDRARKWVKVVTASRRHGLTAKNNTMVRAVFEPRTAASLLVLPDVLMKQAHARLAMDPSTAASLAMRAVAVAFLTSLPLRLSNLQKLRFDSHLQRANPRGRITHIDIPANEVKNNRSIMFPVPPDLAALLDEWRERFAPHFSLLTSPYLFPGKVDQVITVQGLRDAIKSATLQSIGIAISPHQFRHLAATRLLRASSGNLSDAQKYLAIHRR